MAKKAAKKTTKKVVRPVETQEPNNQSVTDEAEEKFSVAVLGDAWYRSFIAPENKNCYRLFLNSGAARLCEMIKAAFYDHAHDEEHKDKDNMEWDEKHKSNVEINDDLVPITDYRWCRYGQLKKYNMTENFKNFNNDVLSGIFNKETYKNDVWRIEKNFGACPVIGMVNTDNNNIDENYTKLTGKEKVWIIHQDTPEPRVAIEKEDHNKKIRPQKSKLVEKIKTKLNVLSYKQLPHFFWYHYEFGNDADIENDPLKSFLLGDEKLAVNILSKTIVFLRLQGLTKYEIGRREDLSVEECLRSVLKGFENRNMQKILKKCKAIVISCGIELAFLIPRIICEKKTDGRLFCENNSLEIGNNIYPKKIHAIFRYIQTADYYQNDRGFVQALGSLMMTSCLKALLEEHFSRKKENEKDDVINNTFIKILITGIHDGLWRMLLHYNSGYLVTPSREDEKIYKNFFGDTQIHSNYFTHFKTIYAATSFKNHTEKRKREKEAQDEAIANAEAIVNRESGNKLFEPLRNHYKGREIVLHTSGTQDVEVNIRVFKDSIYDTLFSKELYSFSFIKQHCNDTNINHHDYACRIVKEGIESLIVESNVERLANKKFSDRPRPRQEEVQFPIAHFGNRTMIDPEEIEKFRHIMMLMRKYITEPGPKPLSIGVFGPPGTGKSSNIIQVTSAAFGFKSEKELKIVECNLAQFTSPNELAKRLHDAQDLVLKDKVVPIILLDEFDSRFEDKQYGWFKYLLPILNEGVFKLGDSEYHLGSAIVVCAGGIHSSFKELDKLREEKNKDFIYLKGPDLISRLRGIVDIKGPNQLDADDKHYIFRRAVILRGLLKQHMPMIIGNDGKAEIGRSVLNAFLRVETYKFGTRSMEALIEMSLSAHSRYPDKFVAAMLPPTHQLDIHVDSKEFMNIIHGVQQ